MEVAYWSRAVNMNGKLLEHFRVVLLKRRADLLDIEESGRQAAATVELDQSRVGRLSRMDAMQQQAMARATGQRRSLELRRIAVALERIDGGDFGLCLECDEEIAAGRLEVEPAATLCVRCAEKAD